ncbi:hypothetical protein BKI52_19345 [marine bacterium AO1-C]|nr:hypothetical protein BKI52_19345 [marine bacterium AO1-C]
MEFLSIIDQLSDHTKQQLRHQLKQSLSTEVFELVDVLYNKTNQALSESEKHYLQEALKQAFQDNPRLGQLLQEETGNDQTIQQFFVANINFVQGRGTVFSGDIKGSANVSHQSSSNHNQPKAPTTNARSLLPALRDNIPKAKGAVFHETTELKANIQEINTILDENGICCLQGMAGIGKTSLALEIARQKVQDNSYDIIWWLDADQGKSLDKMQASWEEFAKTYHITKTSKEVSLSDINSYLASKKWLLIYDNACDGNSITEVSKFYEENIAEHSQKKQQILITSRNLNWKLIEEGIMDINLKTWTSKSIKAFFKNAGIKVPDVTQLEILGGLPLTSALAKSFINERSGDNKSFEKFYEAYKNTMGYLKNPENLSPHYKKKFKGKYPQTHNITIFMVIKTSFDSLDKSLQNLLKALCHFAPDEIPVKILSDNNSTAHPFGSLDYPQLDERLSKLKNLSFITITHQDKEQYSIHRLIHECVQELTDDQEKIEHVKNTIVWMKNAFKAESIEKFTLIPHVDYVFEQSSKLSLSDIKAETSELFYEAGTFHYNRGETEKAGRFFARIDQLVDDDTESSAKINIMLAKTIFLQGKDFFDKAIELAEKAQTYFEQHHNLTELIKCKNDVLAKVYQRKCRFIKTKKILEEVLEIAINNADFNDKLSGIYHNLASLYWTWGRENTPEGIGENDYETAVYYFKEALIKSDDVIDKLDTQKEQAQDTTTRKKFEHDIANKKLYQNVSRMIFGAVYGLLQQFDQQAIQHQTALNYFKDKGKERRRLAYTAYYMLSYGWDREVLNETNSSIGKCFYFGQEDFSERRLIEMVDAQKDHLAKDEKYQLIVKITTLRLTLRKTKYPGKYTDTPTHFNSKKLQATFKDLQEQLESMKYTHQKNGMLVVRYYDVDTCSVSAVLDYGAHLFYMRKLEEAREVITLAQAMTQDIMYHRKPELLTFVKQLNLV